MENWELKLYLNFLLLFFVHFEGVPPITNSESSSSASREAIKKGFRGLLQGHGHNCDPVEVILIATNVTWWIWKEGKNSLWFNASYHMYVCFILSAVGFPLCLSSLIFFWGYSWFFLGMFLTIGWSKIFPYHFGILFFDLRISRGYNWQFLSAINHFCFQVRRPG